MRLHLECWDQCWAPQNLGALGRAQRRATKVAKGLEHLCCEERLRELGLLHLDQRLRIPSMAINACREGQRGRAQQQGRGHWALTGAQEGPCDHQEHCCAVRVVEHCTGTRQAVGFPPQRSSNPPGHGAVHQLWVSVLDGALST